ncbi:MAG: hypothetical protein JWL89_207 [Candidatus Saccharibacteria bacterium]|nr:hypothetical protein [Candidatus Saccharibacteria bacterium]
MTDFEKGSNSVPPEALGGGKRPMSLLGLMGVKTDFEVEPSAPITEDAGPIPAHLRELADQAEAARIEAWAGAIIRGQDS